MGELPPRAGERAAPSPSATPKPKENRIPLRGTNTFAALDSVRMAKRHHRAKCGGKLAAAGKCPLADSPLSVACTCGTEVDGARLPSVQPVWDLQGKYVALRV